MTSETSIWETFAHRVYESHGRRLHYAIGGSGEPVLLVPRWPQNWCTFLMTLPGASLSSPSIQRLSVTPASRLPASIPERELTAAWVGNASILSDTISAVGSVTRRLPLFRTPFENSF